MEAVGAVTGAGTNCGSCRPEIARLITAGRKQEAPDERKTHAA
ncbi:MAG: (2Fe-2S)-binding protein [Caulobacteraceae bacterium]